MPSERTRVYLDDLDDRFENREKYYEKFEKIKINFKYNKKKDETEIYIFEDDNISDIRVIDGVLNWRIKNKIKDELMNEYKMKK
jgi:hypothetical protein